MAFLNTYQNRTAPITIQWKLCFRKLLVSISSCVGIGNALPKLGNISANTGMTKMSRTLTSTTARQMTAIG